MNSSTPVIAIVGRPNVGKSTLFNRLVGYRKAIVDGTPGVTRDRNYHLITIDERDYFLIDTGGFEPVAKDDLKNQMMEQTMLAIEEADLIVLICDGKEGKNPVDEEVAKTLRSSGKKVVLVVNKIDDPIHEQWVNEFYSLGFAEILSTSAEHKIGIGGLKDCITRLLPREQIQSETVPEKIIKVSIIGRPNTGKSSLINNILGTNRNIVNEKAGTTRDSIDSLVRANGKEYLFIDTAGIRKKSRVSQKLEKYSVIMALKSVERSDILVLMIDAMEGVSTQDVKIAAQAHEVGRGCIIAVNKWDLLEKETNTFRDFEMEIREKLPFMDFVPVLSISALTGKRVEKLFPAIDSVYANYSSRIPTAEITRIFEYALRKQPPPIFHKKSIRMFFATQAKVCPPTFICFVNRPDGIDVSYIRYLENQIRERFPFEGSPIRIFFRERERK